MSSESSGRHEGRGTPMKQEVNHRVRADMGLRPEPINSDGTVSQGS